MIISILAIPVLLIIAGLTAAGIALAWALDWAIDWIEGLTK